MGRRLRRSGGGAEGRPTPSAAAAAADEEGRPSFPARLLTLRDRDGKTPLDLAIKKKRTGCELVLREYGERLLAQRGARGWSHALGRALRQVASVKAWKAWMGLTAEAQSGALSPSFPFYLVLTSMTAALLMYPAAFLPVWGADPGRLWDMTGLHLFTLSSMAAMWISFLLTWRTDPGLLGGGGGGAGTADAAGAARSPAGGCGASSCGNGPIRRETGRATRRLRRLYDETLESYSEETTDPPPPPGRPRRPPHPPLCHSCHIVKPLRSKHCRVSRRCILVFDHHCPFVGTSVGLYNYRHFYLFLLTGSSTLIGFVPTWIAHLARSPSFPPIAALTGLLLSMFAVPFFGMLLYHTQLIGRNLTTNEHQNLWRFKYLQDEYGRYRNPFDQGRVRNALGRLCWPGEGSYALPPPSPSPAAAAAAASGGTDGGAAAENGRAAAAADDDDDGGGGGEDNASAAMRREEEERRDLLRNAA